MVLGRAGRSIFTHNNVPAFRAVAVCRFCLSLSSWPENMVVMRWDFSGESSADIRRRREAERQRDLLENSSKKECTSQLWNIRPEAYATLPAVYKLNADWDGNQTAYRLNDTGRPMRRVHTPCSHTARVERYYSLLVVVHWGGIAFSHLWSGPKLVPLDINDHIRTGDTILTFNEEHEPGKFLGGWCTNCASTWVV